MGEFTAAEYSMSPLSPPPTVTRMVPEKLSLSALEPWKGIDTVPV